MSTARFNTLTDAAGGNSMPVADINQGRAKVWFNLNGTGTIALRDSFNVSAIQDNGVGDYSIAFVTLPFANANYATVLACDENGATSSALTVNLVTGGAQTNSVRVEAAAVSDISTRTNFDPPTLTAVLFGDQ